MQTTLEKYLSAILNSVGTEDEPYIIDTALQGYEDGTADKFKQAFGLYNGKHKLPIDVLLGTYPDVKSQVNAVYSIQRSHATEDTENGSIGIDSSNGNSVGRAETGESNITESLVVKQDDNGYYVTTSNRVVEIIGVDETSNNLIDFEHTGLPDSEIRLTNLFGNILGKTYTFSYVAGDTGYRKDYGGMVKGYPMREAITIYSISNNVDTCRCLDSILRYILIMMRSSEEEGDYYQIPNLSSGNLGIVGDIESEKPIYQIAVTVTYNVTYQVPKDSATKINKILFSGLGNGKEHIVGS